MTGARALLVITGNQRRGAETFACQLAQRLAQRGVEPRVVALAPSAVGPHLPVETLGPAPLAPRTLRRLRREISATDVVLACGSTTLPATVIAGRGVRTPVVYQNIGDPLAWARSRARRARVRALLGRTASVVALTESAAAVYRDAFGLPADRLRVIRNARSSTRFRPATPEQRRAARQQLGLPAAGPVAVMVGALGPEKRVDVAISALERTGRSVHLAVAGDGPLRAELTGQAARVAAGRVTFLGQLADPVPVYHAADLLVLTSATEGVPGVLIEAALCGLPAVATDVGFVADVVVHGRTGLLVPPGDSAAVAAAVDDVLDRAGELGANARSRGVHRFDLERISDQWADLLTTMATPARHSGGRMAGLR